MKEIEKISLIKCVYGNSCFIKLENIGNANTLKKVLKLDFNIQKFKILNQGWKEYSFPENIVINDKLYLDEELKDVVVEILDSFIKRGTVIAVSDKVTNRGFPYLKMKDLNDNEISIQDSSAASEAHIWFGFKVNNELFQDFNGNLEKFSFPSKDILICDRLHLNKRKAIELKKMIEEEWSNNK